MRHPRVPDTPAAKAAVPWRSCGWRSLAASARTRAIGSCWNARAMRARRRLPLEFVVIGHTENDAPLLKTGKVFVTGPYSEGEAPHLLRRERPDLVFLPSVWPETWSYVLDEALESGLPIVAFDLGAIAERLRAAERGRVVAADAEPATN